MAAYYQPRPPGAAPNPNVDESKFFAYAELAIKCASRAIEITTRTVVRSWGSQNNQLDFSLWRAEVNDSGQVAPPARHRLAGQLQFGYGLNYLIDITHAVIVDVQATPARTSD
jgi:hypothetical protein